MLPSRDNLSAHTEPAPAIAVVPQRSRTCPVDLHHVSSFQVAGTVAARSALRCSPAVLYSLTYALVRLQLEILIVRGQPNTKLRAEVAGPTPSASGARATGGTASLAACSPSPTRRHQSCSAQASLAIAPAEPRDAAPLASRAGPPQVVLCSYMRSVGSAEGRAGCDPR